MKCPLLLCHSNLRSPNHHNFQRQYSCTDLNCKVGL
uniref:Uncharacterized protein n=1 Tax=Arundo donax TaxID=35708 RepID=A0A0A8YJU0_ARUDO